MNKYNVADCYLITWYVVASQSIGHSMPGSKLDLAQGIDFKLKQL
jgi:hypothetical protein